jgi:putative molybdopterin biosynthesis protein
MEACMIVMTQDMVYTIEEVAKILKVHKDTIRRLVNSGQLEHVRVGNQIRITKAALEKYLGQSLP